MSRGKEECWGGPKSWRSPRHPEKCWCFGGPLHWLWGSFKIYGLGSRKKKMKSRISPISVHCSTLPDFWCPVKSHLGTQVRSHPPPALAFGLGATWVTTSSDANNPSCARADYFAKHVANERKWIWKRKGWYWSGKRSAKNQNVGPHSHGS